MFEKLLSPIKIGTLEVRNRVVMEPMGNGLGEPDGKVSEGDIAFYAARAKGGTGLIVTEAIPVDSVHGRGNTRQMCIDDDSQIPGYQKLADAIHAEGGAIFVEIYHPGCQGIIFVNGNEPMISPSGQESQLMHMPTREMSNAECYEIIQKFIDAAVRCKKAGCDGVTVHASHGYLLNQFMSPYTNHRTDEFGGDINGRAKIVVDIIKGIREACGDYPIAVRISADEYLDYCQPVDRNAGITLPMACEFAKLFEAAGADCIDVSAGTYESMNTAWEPTGFDQGWKAHLAEGIKKVVSVPVICTSVIRDPEYAEMLLQNGVCDMVGSARQQLADPEWANKAKEGRVPEIRKCISCLNCMQTLTDVDTTGEPVQCAINATSCRENIYNDLKEDGDGRVVVVVGAGPAGLEAARVLAMRKFKPIVLEAKMHIGGQLEFANKPPKKEKVNYLIDYYKNMCKKYDIEVHLNTEATVETVKSFNPYAVIVSSGSIPVMPGSIPGIRGENVYTVPEILSGQRKIFDKDIIVVGSGMAGLETTEYLKHIGNRPTVYEMADNIAPGLLFQNLIDIEQRLEGVGQYPKHKLLSINEKGCEFENMETHEIVKAEADVVLVSLGVRPNKALVESMQQNFDKVIVVGDAVKGGKIAHAVTGGFKAAYYLE